MRGCSAPSNDQTFADLAIAQAPADEHGNARVSRLS